MITGEDTLTIEIKSNGVILNDSELFEFRFDGKDKRIQLQKLLNRILEDIECDCWTATVSG